MTQVDPYESYYIFTVLYIHFISLFIALIFFYIVQAKAEKGSVKRSFTMVHTLIIIWISGKILKTVSPQLILRWSSNVFYYMGILPLGPAYFLFSRALLGKVDSIKFKILLYIPGFIFFIILLTNPIHYLFYRHYNFETDSFGPVFYAHLGTTYIFIILSVITLFRRALLNKKNKKKVLSLAIGALLPLSINLYYIFASNSPMFDATPIFYNASLIILGISAFYYDFFNFIPQAVTSALNVLPGYISIDENQYGREKKLIGKNYNRNSYSIKIGHKILTINRLINIDSIAQNTQRLQFNLTQREYRHVEIKREIDRKVKSLQQHERLRLAGEVHDILGYSVSSIICLIEACRLKELKGIEYCKKLNQALEITESGVYELKKCLTVKKDSPWKGEFYDLISKIEIYGLQSELLLSEKVDLSENLYEIFYKILKESITNCIKHSHAEKLTISIQQWGAQIHYYIIDDGKGCRDIQMGTGLLNMKHRIENLSGKINFFSESGSGFHISIVLPVDSEERIVLPKENHQNLSIVN